MNERIKKFKEDVKDHFDRNKTRYCCLVTGVVVAGITVIIMKGRYEATRGETYGLKTADTSVAMRPFLFFAKDNTIASTVHRGSSGPPSYIIVCDELPNVSWLSQRSAAIDTGVSETILSKHLSGKLPDVDGLHFRRIGVAVA